MRSILLTLTILALLFGGIAHADGLLFHESFDDLTSITNNNGTVTGTPNFIPGVMDNAINLTGIRKVCYPLKNNFNLTNGTIEFWIKPPAENHLGFFDIGGLVNPNSWGIFKNADYAIMEVKNNVNSYDQAWSPNTLTYDAKWHFIAAPWERINQTTYFKICLDGRCKSYYDGIKPDSYPNLTREFCVGWNQWYGYSESFFDEFNIFNYAKSNQEIYEDYLSLLPERNVTECRMFKPQSIGTVQINCSGLYVNSEPFFARGVGYQPMPIGKTAESLQDKQEMYSDPRIYRDRDFPLLREMNVNTIRTWGEVLNRTFLDAAYNNGVDPIYVLMGFWVDCNIDYSNAGVRQFYIDKFSDYVTEYMDHPAVLAWGLGNENNLGYCSSTPYVDDFYSLGNELARTAYEIEGEDYHPVGIINGDLNHIGIEEFNSDDVSLNYTDFWGNNVYPGETFGNWFNEYATLSGKPLFITEYGIDALNNTNRQEYQNVHAQWVRNQWNEIEDANRTIGATLMAYSDEWWKAGSSSTHDYGGYSTDRHPDGYSNEEWWGVVSIEDNGSAPDIVHPRQIYYTLRNEFANYTADLEVINFLKISPETSQSGQNITFYYKIFNHGTKNMYNLFFGIDTDSAAVTNITNSIPITIMKDSSYFGFIQWSYPSPGSYQPTFYIDYNNNYMEVDEENNNMSTSVSVITVRQKSNMLRKTYIIDVI